MEAGRAGAQARLEKRRASEGTTQQKIARALDNLTQAQWDRAVRDSLGSATGMQALTRLLDRLDGKQPEPEAEGRTMTEEERAAVLASIASKVRGRGASDSPAGTEASSSMD